MSNQAESARPRHPNCLKCAYFRVTWDPSFPRACDLFGVKTSSTPAVEVYRATGRVCSFFEEKKGLKKS